MGVAASLCLTQYVEGIHKVCVGSLTSEVDRPTESGYSQPRTPSPAVPTPPRVGVRPLAPEDRPSCLAAPRRGSWLPAAWLAPKTLQRQRLTGGSKLSNRKRTKLGKGSETLLDPMPILQTVILMTWQNRPADHVSLEMHSGFASYFFFFFKLQEEGALGRV